MDLDEVFTKSVSSCDLKHIVKVLQYTAESWKNRSSCYISSQQIRWNFSQIMQPSAYCQGFGIDCRVIYGKRGLQDCPPSALSVI